MSCTEFGSAMPIIPTEFWPVKEPQETANFSYDATADITSNSVLDPIAGATFCTMPSGTGEITSSRLTVANNFVTVWLAGGVPGRNYIHNLTFTTNGGVTLQILIGQVCDSVLASIPVPPSPTPGFGPVLNWP